MLLSQKLLDPVIFDRVVTGQPFHIVIQVVGAVEELHTGYIFASTYSIYMYAGEYVLGEWKHSIYV